MLVDLAERTRATQVRTNGGHEACEWRMLRLVVVASGAQPFHARRDMVWLVERLAENLVGRNDCQCRGDSRRDSKKAPATARDETGGGHDLGDDYGERGVTLEALGWRCRCEAATAHRHLLNGAVCYGA